MSIFNQVTLVGNIGQDPEYFDFGEGRSRARFSLATNERFTAKDGTRQERTYWHRIVVWGKKSEYVKNYFEKGKRVMLTGKLIYNEYENDLGEKRSIAMIQASDLKLMDKKLIEA